MVVRCKWCNLKNAKYIEYHDNEWCKPNFDDKYLFEMLILELFQAGLSWECVLNKRENFRKAFDNFDIDKICNYNEKKVQELLENEKIIRNKLKITATINNSKIFKKIQNEYGTFYNYLNKFTEDKIIYEIGKTSNQLSDIISQDLQKRGMKFVGSTIIYSYLQAIGVIYSHDKECFMYKDNMDETTIYLIRHAETVDENGIRNTSENSQSINEKEILSVKGEEQAKKLSENEELKNLDSIWSSSYTRAKATAKYIANVNNLPFNLDNGLSERKLGDLKELGEFMKDKSTRDPSQEQLLERTFRTSDGESAEQTRERMNKFFEKILEEYKGKRIAVISHGGSIKFFLLNWCDVNEDVKLVYNKNLILNIKSPCLLKLTFRDNVLINIEQID